MAEPSPAAPSIVVHFTDTRGFGGAERMLLTMLASFDRTRWQPWLMVHDDPGVAPLVDEARQLDVRICVVRRMTGLPGLVRLPSFVAQLRRLRPGLFHAHLNWPLHCTHALLGAFMAGVPTVASQHLYVQLPSRRKALEEKLMSIFVGRYLAVSYDMQCRMRERVLLGRRIHVVRNGISLEVRPPGAGAQLREWLLGGDRRALVLTVARLHEHKGLLTLVHAATGLPEALFVIAGEGPQRAGLEREIESLGLQQRVLLLGHRVDIPDLLDACDLYVLPSLFEGLPISVLEAMAASKPVVASDIGGSNELVRDGENGLLFPPGDATALARAISQIISDTELACRMAASGRERVVREFAADRVLRGVTAVYAELSGDSAASDAGE